MSFNIFLYPFESDGNDSLSQTPLLGKLRTAAERASAGFTESALLAADGASFSIELPGGSAMVGEAFAQFPIESLDPLSMRVIFEVARMGNMVICPEGAEHRKILTADSNSIPLQQDQPIEVCGSADQLEFMLRNWLSAQQEYQARALPLAKAVADPGSVPGTRPDGGFHVAYIQALIDESPLKQQKRVFKYNSELHRNNVAPAPIDGLIMAAFWSLTTPAGISFYAYRYGGQHSKWCEMIRGFADLDGRLVGKIEEGVNFVQSDGRVYGVEMCSCINVGV